MILRVTVYCLFAAIFFSPGRAFGQPYTSIELKKNKPYENRKLPSEKSDGKKFPVPKRIYHNTVTHYNYYFNANTRLNDIIDRAKKAHKDDYTGLLPFYNYSLDVTAQDEIDTVLYKCTAGILLHDLRSDWVDNLYILMGKAYLFRKDFDSATHVFQYINYAFAPKDGGYDIPLGSNVSNTGGLFTIATNESRSFWKKLTGAAPSRNESFIWQVRTYLEQQKEAEAAGLLEILRTDPRFPARLQAELHELTAYWFYRQQAYDSSAWHITQVLKKGGGKKETARWEYLAAQLYQLSGKDREALQLFQQAIQHTNDPFMEVYARLNIAALYAGDKENALQENIDALLKMARRDRYDIYRDIIYYASAKLELSRKNYPAAQQLLLKSIASSNDNPLQKQQGFLLLADMNYDRKQYTSAYHFYDSIEVDMLKQPEQERIQTRKPALQIIAENEVMIHREDSVLQIAMLPEAERNAVLRKIWRQLRRERGLKDTGEPSFGTSLPDDASAGSDLFGNNSAAFYFLSSSVKSRGANEFRNRWGTRPNVDNWRRESALNRSTAADQVNRQQVTRDDNAKTEKEELTLEALTNTIPLTPDQKDASHTILATAMMSSAATFQNHLEDYSSAIEMYRQLLQRFPAGTEAEQALFNLVQCYRKTDHTATADSIAALFKKQYADSKLALLLSKDAAGKKEDPAAQQYEAVYRLFIEGRFAQALKAKQDADQQSGQSYWTPQLLYIEAIYYVKQQQDSLAISRLNDLQTLFAGSPMAERAQVMINVLERRKEIEDYLTNLSVERKEEMVSRGVDLNNAAPALVPVIKKDTASIQAPREIKASGIVISNDTKAQPLAETAPVFEFDPADSHYAVVALDKVDPVFVNEARNAFNRFNRERYFNQPIPVSSLALKTDLHLLLIGPFANAADAVSYADRVKTQAASRIIPWLAADKYSFNIISPTNLGILKNNADMPGYRAFIQKVLPDKF